MRSLKGFVWMLLLAVACEERTDVPISPVDTDLLVVEAVLTNERKNHLVTLSHPYTTLNGEPSPASGASVYIFEDSAGYALTEFPPGSGKYYTPVARAVFGKRYTLIIQYGGKQFLAQDNSVPVQPLPDIRYRQTDEGYTLILNPDGDDPNYIEHIISWRHTGECATPASCEGSVFFYDLKTIDVNDLYKPDKLPFHFPRQSIVIRKKYSVSPAYKNFLRSVLSETEWRGGVFDVQRANVPTNLSAGAVGFFAVCTVVSDTTVVQ